jgi:D-inositol-3-phosphate glycosyltransferase
MKTWWEWTGSQPQNTCVIPYGVDPNLFYPIPGARAKLGFPAQQMTLVYAGRFSAEKGLLDLLQALALVKDQAVHKSLKVYLIGSGPQESRLRDFIKTHRLDEVVCIQTWVTKTGLAAWYSAADALVLPSHSEAFSRTIPEALSCGAPVIGSAISGTQDHITPQVNGFLFPPGDTASLAQILFTILDHPERLAAMRPAASEYARRTFPWQVVMQRILQEVYYPLSNL